MAHIIWKETFNLGIDVIDEQHKKLIEIINELYDAQKTGTSQSIISDILNKLVDYTIYHFTMEQEIHFLNKYPAMEVHRNEHDDFINQLYELKKDSNRNNLLLSLKTLDFLKDWTINHILGSDKEFGEYLKNLEGI